jgi:hypothetical protein
MDLPLGKGARPENRGLPHDCAAIFEHRHLGHFAFKKVTRLLLLLLARGGGAAPAGAAPPSAPSPLADGIVRLLSSVSTYYHPCNSNGAWAETLAPFLSGLATNLAKRCGEESALGPRPVGLALRAPDVRALVLCLLPLVFEGLYSKSDPLVQESAKALRSLVAVAPAAVCAVCHPVLRLQQGLGEAAATSPHQVPAALRALTALVRPLMFPRPVLLPHLPELLSLTLPGVDPNDPMKSGVTLGLYQSLLCWLPLVQFGAPADTGGAAASTAATRALALGWQRDFECTAAEVTAMARACGSEDPGLAAGPPSDAARAEEERESARRVSAALEDWAPMFLEKTLRVAEMAAEYMGGSGEKKKAKGKGGGGHSMEAYVAAMLHNTLLQFFAQMSAPMHEAAAKKLFDYACCSFKPAATKQIAGILGTLSMAQPAATLKRFLPHLLRTLNVAENATGASPGAFPADMSEGEVVWNVRLVDGVVRKGGAHLLPYKGRLAALLQTCLSHAAKKVRKAGGKLLRHSLLALLGYYPSDYRSLPPAMCPWAQAGSGVTTASADDYLQWGMGSLWQDADIQWHQPSPEERAFADELVQAHVEQPMQVGQASAAAAQRHPADALPLSPPPPLPVLPRSPPRTHVPLSHPARAGPAGRSCGRRHRQGRRRRGGAVARSAEAHPARPARLCLRAAGVGRLRRAARRQRQPRARHTLARRRRRRRHVLLPPAAPGAAGHVPARPPEEARSGGGRHPGRQDHRPFDPDGAGSCGRARPARGPQAAWAAPLSDRCQGGAALPAGRRRGARAGAARRRRCGDQPRVRLRL